MFSKAVLTVKDLVMPTGLRHLSNHGRTSNDVLTILTDRALKMYRDYEQTTGLTPQSKMQVLRKGLTLVFS